MERGRGTTIAAILMAGLLMRPGGGSPNADNSLPPPNTQSTRTSLKEVSGDGPWKASCRYWQQERTLADGKQAPDKNESLDAEAHDTKASIDLHITARKDEAPDCPGASDRWGAPDQTHLNRISYVRSLIASVPVPVHTHLAVLFDRDLDMLLSASADNAFFLSYSWLPWKAHEEKGPGIRSDGGDEKDSTADEPGLLIRQAC